MDTIGLTMLLLIMIFGAAWFYFYTKEKEGLDSASLLDYLRAERAARAVLNSIKEIKDVVISVSKKGVFLRYSCLKDDLYTTVYYIAGLYAGIVGKATAPVGDLYASADIGDKTINYHFSAENGLKLYDAGEGEQEDLVEELINSIQIREE